MAVKEKKVTRDSKVERAATEESKAAAKVSKAAKGNKKSDKPNPFVRAGKGAKRFFKDFKGECKKIVWPDAKTVLKSTGVVILVVLIVGLVVFGIDTGLSAGVNGLKGLATKDTETTAVADEHDHDEEEEAAETTKADAETTKADSEETTAADKDAENTTQAND